MATRKRIKNIDEMLPFVQIPSQKTEPIKIKVKEIIVEPVMTNDQIKAREGTYFDEKGITVYDEDVDIFSNENGSKKLLARFRKNVIPKELLELGWEAFYKTAAPSRNRGAAAGPIQLKSAYWQKRKPTEVTKWSAKYIQDGKVSHMRVNNNVFSSVLGYFEQTPFMGLPCRLTSYTQLYFDQYKAGTPYIEAIDKLFKKLVPDRYAVQYKRAKRNPAFQIGDTSFSSVTINRNFRTGLHQDAGDLKEGFGNLTVIERGKYSGGYTLFPRYKIGVNLRTGDFLAMDVHEWHCNTEMKEESDHKKFNSSIPEIYKNDKETGTQGIDKLYSRVSFVCYLREKLADCNAKESLPYYKRIGYNPKTKTLTPKKSQTRKKRLE